MPLSKERDKRRKEEERADTWRTDSFSLEPEDPIQKLIALKPFRRSEDKRGHAVFLGAWFSKEIGRDIGKVKELGPYETNSDVIRDAVYRGIQVLRLAYEKDEGWKSEMLLTRMVNEAAYESKIYKQEEDFVSALDRLVKNGDKEYASQLVQERVALMTRSPDSERRLNVLSEQLRRARLEELLKA